MKKAMIIGIMALTANSCKNFLDREPVEQISIKNEFSTKEGVLKALNGAYYQLKSLHFGMAKFVYADLLGGNLVFSPNPGSSAQYSVVPFNLVAKIYDFADYTNDKVKSDMDGFYENSYQLINNLNLILENMDSASGLTDADKSEIKAEVLALRAFAHFELYKVYAQNYTYTPDAKHLGIVYNTSTLKVGVDFPARLTAAETFEKLEADIAAALPLFGDAPALSVGTPKNFMSKTAAKTLAAEVYLWKNDWQNAYNFADDVIKTSVIPLAQADDFKTNWASSERIFDLANTSTGNSYAEAIYDYTSATSYSEFSASADLVNLYPKNDVRLSFLEQQNLKTKIGNNVQTLPYFFCKKYKYGVDDLVYRMTELYMIRAEAAYHLGNSAQALADINIIRARAGAAQLSAVTLDDIILENRLEFAFENHYFFDLMRNHRNVVRNSGCISANCSPAYPYDHFVAPIPYQSLYVNSHMVQNPGY